MVGPTFRGMYGQTLEVITDGKPKRVLADETHLRASIRNPRAQRLKGYPDVMPAIDLAPPELDEIVTYIKTLK
jgi:cytochrome c oxidase subunit 2